MKNVNKKFTYKTVFSILEQVEVFKQRAPDPAGRPRTDLGRRDRVHGQAEPGGFDFVVEKAVHQKATKEVDEKERTPPSSVR